MGVGMGVGVVMVEERRGEVSEPLRVCEGGVKRYASCHKSVST